MVIGVLVVLLLLAWSQQHAIHFPPHSGVSQRSSPRGKLSLLWAGHRVRGSLWAQARTWMCLKTCKWEWYACHQAPRMASLGHRLLREGKRSAPDWRLRAVACAGPLSVIVVCRMLPSHLYPPAQRLMPLEGPRVAGRWVTLKWTSLSRISKGPAAMWWQQSGPGSEERQATCTEEWFTEPSLRARVLMFSAKMRFCKKYKVPTPGHGLTCRWLQLSEPWNAEWKLKI